mgnify:CR=1 FL=1|tara:strand:+ start:9978 stop:10862 length:885 start_codon:yes stop_codon:yes gene_type:complete
MANNEQLDIFNLGIESVEVHKQEDKKSDLYKPKAADGKDGTYKALIRFVPNPQNPRKSLVRKLVYWLTDMDNNGTLVDSPSTVGDKCPIQQMFFKLRKSESAVDRKMSEKLKRREQFYSIIKVLKDPQNPDMEGQYKIFKFGRKIKIKIDEEMMPNFGEPTQVFDLFNGKNFELVITKQGDFNNYDTCKFSNSNSSIMVNDVQMENSEEHRALIKEDLDKAPELAPFDYKPWDDEITSKVQNILNQYRSPGDHIENIVNTPVKETKKVAPKATSTKVAAEGSDDLDSFLNDLDI